MRAVYVFAGILMMLSGTARPAQCQSADPPRSWTFGATAGAGKTWDDEGSIGSGLMVGGYVDRRIARRVELDLSADLVKHERNTGPFSFQAEGHTTYLSAALLFRFGPRTANGFLIGGGTLAVHRGTAGLGGGNLRDTDSTHPGVILGGGLSFRAGESLEIAPLVRMTLMRMEDDSDPFSSILAGVRVGFTRR